MSGFLLPEQMLDLIMPVIQKIERKPIALLLISLQGQQSLQSIARSWWREAAVLPQGNKRGLRKRWEMTQSEG